MERDLTIDATVAIVEDILDQGVCSERKLILKRKITFEKFWPWGGVKIENF